MAMDELLQEFISETQETLEALAGEVVAWEADPSDRDRLDAIFRFFHTVKGSCGFLNLPGSNGSATPPKMCWRTFVPASAALIPPR